METTTQQLASTPTVGTSGRTREASSTRRLHNGTGIHGPVKQQQQQQQQRGITMILAFGSSSKKAPQWRWSPHTSTLLSTTSATGCACTQTKPVDCFPPWPMTSTSATSRNLFFLLALCHESAIRPTALLVYILYCRL